MNLELCYSSYVGHRYIKDAKKLVKVGIKENLPFRGEFLNILLLDVGFALFAIMETTCRALSDGNVLLD